VGRTLAIHTGRAFFNLVVRPALVGQGVHAFALSRRMGHGIHRFVKKLAPARRSGKANRSK
jgi:ribosomal protein S19